MKVIMKALLRSLLVSSVAALIAAGCASNAATTAIPTVVLGGNAAPVAGTSRGTVAASGEVVPEPKASLSFPLTGTVKTVEVEVGDEVSRGDVLITLDTALWEAKVGEAEGALAAAEAEERLQVRNGADQEHIDAANADVDTALAAVESAKATLQQATLTAPFDGTIASVDISPAETVTPGLIVIMLGDLTNFQVITTDLSERDVPAVRIGQVATITVAALGEDFPGKVTGISRISSTVGGDVVYEVTLEFDAQPQGLLWGMTTEVRIDAGE
jgi:membrane fusion protein (multidrug efflux system)